MNFTKTNKLTAIISTVRHGQKDEAGELTESGAKQASEKALGIEHLQGDVVLLHSGAKRVRDTLTWMAKSLLASQPNPGNFTDYASHYLHYLYDPQNKGELFGKWDEVNGDMDAEFDRMQNFLNLADNSTEPEVYPSPRKMAVRLARVIATEIDFATITMPDVRTNYINGSHEPVVMAFLYYFLQDFNPNNPNFLKEIGGILDFAEGFEIKVYQNLAGSNKVIFNFRNISKELDQNVLKDFCRS